MLHLQEPKVSLRSRSSFGGSKRLTTVHFSSLARPQEEVRSSSAHLRQLVPPSSI